MNKNTIITIISIIVIVGLVFVFVEKNKNDMIQETPEQVLDRSTQDDTVNTIENDLDNIDINASSSTDFESVNMQINSL